MIIDLNVFVTIAARLFRTFDVGHYLGDDDWRFNKDVKQDDQHPPLYENA
jgi:hypothetical protein